MKDKSIDKKKKTLIISLSVASAVLAVTLIVLLCVFLIPSAPLQLKNGNYYFSYVGNLQKDVVLTIEGNTYTFNNSDDFSGSGRYIYDGEKDFTFFDKNNKEYIKGMLLDDTLIFFKKGTKYSFKFSETPPEREKLDYTLGLKYQLNGSTYEVLGIDKKTILNDIPNDIVLPKEYKGVRVTGIAPHAFDAYYETTEAIKNKLKEITSVKLGENIAQIGSYAFNGCTALTQITNANNLSKIDNFAFCDCNALIDIVGADNLSHLGSCCFDYCNALNFYEEGGIKYFKNWAMAFITKSKTSIVVKEGTIGLYENIFSHSNLNQIELPSTMKYIGRKALYPILSLNKIDVKEGNKNLKSIENSLYSFDGKVLYCVPAKSVSGALTIPNTVEEIKYGALYGVNITELKTPFIGLKNGVSGENALLSSMFGSSEVEGFSKLVQHYFGAPSCYIPNINEISVTSSSIIGEGALSSDIIKNVGVYESTLRLKKLDVSKATLFLPNAMYGLTSLTDIKLPFVGSTEDSGVFGEIFSNEFYNGSVKAEQIVDGRKEMYYLPSALQNVEVKSQILPVFAFSGCSNLKSVVFSNGVNLIEEIKAPNGEVIDTKVLPGVDGAFANCDNLATIDLGINYIFENYRLYDKEKKTFFCSLKSNVDTSFTVDDNIIKISPYAFAGSNVENLTIGKNIDCLTDVFKDSKISVLNVPIENRNFEDFKSQGLIMTMDKKDIVFISSTLAENVILPSTISTLPNFDKFNIASFSIDGTSSKYFAFDGFIYNKDKSLILAYPKMATGEIEILNSVVSIDYAKFNDGVTKFSIVNDAHTEEAGEIYSSENGVLYNALKTNLKFVPKDISGSLILPESLEEISDNAFNARENLTDVTIGKNVTVIGVNAFSNITATVNFDEFIKIQSISKTAFNDYLGEALSLPQSLTVIEKGQLKGAKNLVSLTLPFSGANLNAKDENKLFGYIFGDESFNGGVVFKQKYGKDIYAQNDKGETEVSKYEKDYYIPTSLTDVTLLKQKTLLYGVFSNMTALKKITVGYEFDGSLETESVRNAFLGCSSLVEFNIIPDKVVGEGESQITYKNPTFKSVNGILYKKNTSDVIYRLVFIPNAISEYELPADCQEFDKDVFTDCALETLTVNNGNAKYIASGNCIIEKNAKAIVSCIKTSIIPTDGDIAIEIRPEAFYEIDRNESVFIPENIQTIGAMAFYGSTFSVNCKVAEKPIGWDENWNKLNNDGDKIIVVHWGMNA